jgi:hypothetical protein
MNRKKKINQILQKRLKRMNNKLNPNNKPKYISKADRALLEAQTAQETDASDIDNETSQQSSCASETTSEQ